MKENSKSMSYLFTVLMRRSVFPGFAFPGGKIAEQRVDACLDYLTLHYGTVGLERIVNFCVCQVYAISGFSPGYLLKWKLSHSFGERACVRFVTRKPGQKYYEDRWLKDCGLDRERLQGIIEDRGVHPFYRFIYPSWEDRTKRRAVSTEAGYFICAASTLLWTPFSLVCRMCRFSDVCQKRTQHLYPELYRIRIAEYQAKEDGNE